MRKRLPCALGRIFFTSLWNAWHARRRHKDGVIDIADFLRAEEKERKKNCTSVCFGILNISRSRRAKIYANTERAIIDICASR